MTVSVVIPVFNGEQYLAEVLDAVKSQRLDEEIEILAIDSGSSDRSVEIIRESGVRLIEIPNEEFQHGRTRNFGVAQTTGRLIAFLTQDATPATDTWLAAYVEAFELDPKVGAAYGPHLVRPGVNPMMARLLTEFFDSFSPDGGPVVQRGDDLTFLSNSNSCISRAAWQAIPFRALPYSEDQALGMDLLAAGWTKVYMPAAGAYHSHDYGLVESWKRYFDEYRGLRDSIGHIEKASATGALRVVASSVRADARWMLRHEKRPPHSTAYWLAQSFAHHSGRVLFGGLGARADRLPPLVRKAISLERRADGVRRRVAAVPGSEVWADVRQLDARGPTPLRAIEPHHADRAQLHIAWIVPPFTHGSGGHTTIFRNVQALERSGHRCTIWVHDPQRIEPQTAAGVRKRLRDHYLPLAADVHLGFDDWTGADVAVATGWQTIYPTLLLDGCGARAYFVQDYEPDFYAQSSEKVFAEHTYRMGLKCVAASPWLAQLLRERHGADATPFLLGVDRDEYSPLDVEREPDTVVYYAREFTPRRAVDLGLLALSEVVERRPQTQVVLFGSNLRLATPFPHEHLGVVDHARLRDLYSRATVGLSTSLTNYSLIPNEMMACGLPVVELAGRACESVYGADNSVITLAADNPVAIADAVCGLLEDRERRGALTRTGLDFTAAHPWDNAFEVVEQTLRAAYDEQLAQATAGAARWQAGSLI